MEKCRQIWSHCWAGFLPTNLPTLSIFIKGEVEAFVVKTLLGQLIHPILALISKRVRNLGWGIKNISPFAFPISIKT